MSPHDMRPFLWS